MAIEKNSLPTAKPVAVIDIGSTFLRLIIAEKRDVQGICVLERVIQSVPLGRNVRGNVAANR